MKRSQQRPGSGGGTSSGFASLGPLPTILTLLIFLLPFVLAAVWLPGDRGHVLSWALTLSAGALIFYPLGHTLCPDLPGVRWILVKALGFMVPAWLVWTLSYLRLFPLSRVTILGVLAIAAAVIWGPAIRRRRAGRADGLKLPDHKGLTAILIAEGIFGVLLVYWSYARGMNPAIDGLEKFMDYGFMLTIDRTDYLPAADMWLAGKPINYYYFGQYAFTYLSKLSGVTPGVAYNLAIATVMAYTGTLAYAIVRVMTQAATRHLRHGAFFSRVASLLGALLVTFGGNSHSFYYASDGPGHGLLKLFGRMGATIGEIDGFFFSDSTRYIGHNPKIEDQTIHEFPYYSFLVADLHAHMINLIFVLLFILLFILLLRHLGQAMQAGAAGIPDAALPPTRLGRALRDPLLETIVKDPRFHLMILCMSVFMMCNFWDFIIYLVVMIMLFFAVALRHYREGGGLESIPLFAIQFAGMLLPFMLMPRPTQQLLALTATMLLSLIIHRFDRAPLTLAGAAAAVVFTLAHALSLPFNLFFDPISKSMALVDRRSDPFQLFILWGPHLLAGFLLVLALIITWARLRRRFRTPGTRPTSSVSAATSGAGAVSAADLAETATTASDASAKDVSTKGASAKNTSAKDASAVTAATSVGTTTKRPGFGALLRLEPMDLVAGLLWLAGFGLILAPEILYVVDIYGGAHKRANTMFKFTYQAFLLLSLVWGYVIARFLSPGSGSAARRRTKLVAGILVTLLTVMPLWYPLTATSGWLGTFSPERYRGLEGTVQLSQKDSEQIPNVEGEDPRGELQPDYQAILWFNEYVEGQPVILEAPGDSYTDYNRISAYTGLPTIMGWQTHQWLWRTSASTPHAYQQVVVPRQETVKAIYEGESDELARSLLDLYQVEYIIVGTLERLKYPALNEDRIMEQGPVVFSNDSLYVVRRDPGYSPLSP